MLLKQLKDVGLSDEQIAKVKELGKDVKLLESEVEMIEGAVGRESALEQSTHALHLCRAGE